MEVTNFWNKFYLHGKKITFLLLFVFCSSQLVAQKSKEIKYAQYDEKKMNYGFVLGGHFDNFIVNQSSSFDQQNFSGLRGTGGLGYTLGFVLNYHVNDIFDLRILPSVGFYERHIKYRDISSGNTDTLETDEIFESTFIEFPILAKFKSIRRGNSRLYFVGGIKPSFEVGANKKKEQISQIRTRTYDLSLELGVGGDMYLPYFKFSPELRFSLGLLNMLEKDNSPISNSIDRMPSYSVSLLFIFE